MSGSENPALPHTVHSAPQPSTPTRDEIGTTAALEKVIQRWEKVELRDAWRRWKENDQAPTKVDGRWQTIVSNLLEHARKKRAQEVKDSTKAKPDTPPVPEPESESTETPGPPSGDESDEPAAPSPVSSNSSTTPWTPVPPEHGSPEGIEMKKMEDQKPSPQELPLSDSPTGSGRGTPSSRGSQKKDKMPSYSPIE